MKMGRLTDSSRIFGGALLLLVVGFFIAYQFVEPAPPRTLTLSTGNPDGAYHLFGERYREYLAEYGIEVQLRTSAGSIENLQRLVAGEVDVAFVQGGTVDEAARNSLQGLGSLYHEPLWVFLRADLAVRDLRGLAGQRVGVGAPGSGTRMIALQLLADNGIGGEVPRELGGSGAADALLAGELDAAFFVASPQSPLILRLLRSPELHLLDFVRAEAYTRRYPYLSVLRLPEGAIDIAANVPATDTALLAPTAQLAAGVGLHPALVDLLLQTGREIHGAPGLFSVAGAFPTARNSDLPMSGQVRRYHELGAPLLQRYLPFWVANVADRLKVMLVPLLTLLFPLMKIVPPTYRWRVRSRIYHWYRDLRQLEAGQSTWHDPQGRQSALDALDRIEFEVAQVHIPLSYSDQLYNLRLHIAHLRHKVRDSRSSVS